MNRDDRFQFKIWDYDRNKFCETWQYDDGEVGGFVRHNIDKKTTIEKLLFSPLAFFLNKKRFRVVQCIGFKDSDGNLMYETDIVKCITDSFDVDIHEIIYGGDSDYPAFELSNNQEDCNGISHYLITGEIKVIGNSFENKGLLREIK